MKTLWNVFPFLLLAALTLALPVAARAQLIFTTNSGAITITGYSGNPTNLDIPITTNGFVVVSIGPAAFENKSTLASVTIPESVTAIGASAFQGCSGLTNIALGEGVTNIGDDAFLYDSRLVNVTIPDNVTSIGALAFDSCTGLTNLSLGSGVTNIEPDAFLACYDLATITVSASNSVFSSAAGVLFNKNQTALVQYPGGKPGNYVVPNGVTCIGDDAFAFCSRLTGVDTSNSVVTIGPSAFANGASLTNIVIGPSVTNLGAGAFDSAGVLLAINVATNNPAYSSVNGILFDKSQTTLLQYPGGKPGNYTTPTNVTVIGNNAFTGCFNLTSLVIGDSVATIGSGAFYECINLTNITIGAGVTNLGSDGFNDSASLTAIDVSPLNPDFSTVRGMLFDKNQTTLLYCPEGIAGSCTIPSSVTNLADFAFLDDFRLTAVYFEGNAPSLGSLVFDDPLTVFYRPGTTGWASPFGGLPAVEWNPQARPVGTGTSPFGLAITGNSNLVVVVEACTNLTQPLWQPVQTNTLTNATAYYSDPQWSNYPARYFRLRSP